MKFVILACLAAVSVASPQFGRQPFRPPPSQFRTPIPSKDSRHIAIISDNRHDQGDGNFAYDFEAENGIKVNAVGRPGSAGQSNIEGAYRFQTDEGEVVEVRYVADENGYRAESPHIPTPHPLPAHAIEQIRFAEANRDRSIPTPAGRRRPF
ncbi:cuticle protein AM1199 [Procambarus clarkii]|uniref:cuticle protein AM1199 n=1 Tax=Procambarus clarkii TaxID=6728 RepID=UPI001E677075|nr:cuticle protein AM1199-like [Procambarus clarkii]